MEVVHAVEGEECLRALLVEDDDGDAALAAYAIHRGCTGLAAWRARSGAEALSFLRRESPYEGAPRPHLIITDLKMPGVTGFDLLMEIRRDEDLAELPVVVFTNSQLADDVATAYRLGASLFITKPADLARLTETVGLVERLFRDVATVPRAADARAQA